MHKLLTVWANPFSTKPRKDYVTKITSVVEEKKRIDQQRFALQGNIPYSENVQRRGALLPSSLQQISIFHVYFLHIHISTCLEAALLCETHVETLTEFKCSSCLCGRQHSFTAQEACSLSPVRWGVLSAHLKVGLWSEESASYFQAFSDYTHLTFTSVGDRSVRMKVLAACATCEN